MIIELGPCPSEETPVQVGTNDYAMRAREECRRYRELIQQKHPQMPKGVKLLISGHEHDFGRYYEVDVKTDAGFEDWAFHIERNLPEKWSDSKPITLQTERPTQEQLMEDPFLSDDEYGQIQTGWYAGPRLDGKPTWYRRSYPQ